MVYSFLRIKIKISTYFCAVLKALNIIKSYGQIKVLDNISLTLNSKEIVAITGDSGAGKSTLLHILGSLDKPNSGEVLFENLDITKLSEKKLAQFRNLSMGFVFQFHHLLPEFSAVENVMLPALIAGKSKNEAKKNAQELLNDLGLSNRLDNKPHQLSGGEQQRVSVARALINCPMMVFADEPTGNLDSRNALELHQLFMQLRDKYKSSFIIVTHNENLAKLSDRVLRIHDGKLLE